VTIYLIRAGESGPVKIGYARSVRDARGRIDSLQVGHWEILRVLRLWEGDMRDERRMHMRFADLRIRGEWFAFSRLMLADVGLMVIEFDQGLDAPMSIGKMVKAFGGVGDVARLCGTSRAVVSRWIWDNHVPEPKRPMFLEHITERGLVGITAATFADMQPSGRPPREETRSSTSLTPSPEYQRYKAPTLLPIIPVESRSDRDAHWLALRAEKRTFAEISKAYGVTKQRVQQVVSRLQAAAANVPERRRYAMRNRVK
jgi:hypothetical protein